MSFPGRMDDPCDFGSSCLETKVKVLLLCEVLGFNLVLVIHLISCLLTCSSSYSGGSDSFGCL